MIGPEPRNEIVNEGDEGQDGNDDGGDRYDYARAEGVYKGVR